MTKTIDQNLTHDERSQLMRTAEQNAILKNLGKMFPLFLSLDLQHQHCAVEAVQLAQKMGGQIELFFGRDTLPEKYFSQIAPALRSDALEKPMDAPLGFAKGLLALKLKHSDKDGKIIPITNYAVAAAELEKLEVQLKLMDAGTRKPIDDPDAPETEAQKRERRLKGLFDQMTSLSLDWLETEKSIPVTGWRDSELTSLLASGKPAHDLYERAETEWQTRLSNEKGEA